MVYGEAEIVSELSWLTVELEIEPRPKATPVCNIPPVHTLIVTESLMKLIESGISGNVPFTLDLHRDMCQDFIRELEIESQYEENPLFDFKFISDKRIFPDKYILEPCYTCVVKEWEIYKSCLRICLQVTYG